MLSRSNGINILQGCILLACLIITSHILAEVPVLRFKVSHYKLIGENPLSTDLTDKTLAPFIGQHEGLDGLLAAADALEQALAKAGFPFHRVSLPPQTLADGEVMLALVTFKIGDIQVKGNQFFSRGNVLRAIPSLKSQQVPSPKQVAEDMRLANQHADRKIKVSFQDTDISGVLNASVEVQDNRPWHLFTTLNNTGSATTGRQRFTLGFEHTNIADLDHSVTFTYTTSPGKGKAFQQVGINYLIPFYNKSMQLGLFYSDSNVDSGRVAGVFDVTGQGQVAGLQLTKFLTKVDTYTHSIRLGVMDQLFISDVQFAGTPIGNDVRSRPLTLSYQGNYQQKIWQLGFHVDYVRNIAGGKNNNAMAYQAARALAKTHWQKLTFGLNGSYQSSNNWLFQSRLEGQLAPKTLIPAEQMSMGGRLSIRGFEESATSGDVGMYYNLELWAPPINKNLRIFGFHDGGFRRLKDTQVGEYKQLNLSSVGFGLRWNVSNTLSLEADYAYITQGIDVDNAQGKDKLHVNMLYRF